MFITDEDYKVVIGESALKVGVPGKHGKPQQCRDGGAGGNGRIPAPEI